MTFQEPKVQFVKIDTGITTYTESQDCPVDELYIGGTPSYELCSGPDAPGNNCTKYHFKMMIN